MSASQVEIYNLALSTAGTRSKVASISETSKECEICNLWYPTVRKYVLRAAPWASARKTQSLALITTRDFDADWADGDPEPPYIYKHGLPADFIYPRYLEDFAQFVIGDEDGTAVFYSNSIIPVLTYTKDQTVPPSHDVGLYLAIVNMLASVIAMNIHGKPARAQKVLDTANSYVIQARVQNANENFTEYDSLPDWLIARGAFTSTTPSRFIYQNGPLLSLLGSF